MADDIARDALSAIDKLLAARPEKVGHDFSAATRRLVAWRQRCIAQWRASQLPADRQCLERVNAAISVVVGGQFPLGEVNWGSIEAARRDLAAIASSG